MARVLDQTSQVCLDVEVNPNMSRAKSKVVSYGNDPFPHDKYGSGELTMAKIIRLLKEGFEAMNKNFDRKTSHLGQSSKNPSRRRTTISL